MTSPAPDQTPVLNLKGLKAMLEEAFDAGHAAWPTPDTPTRAKLCEVAVTRILAALAVERPRPLLSDVTCDVSPIHAGEEGDGPLESTDLYVEGRGIGVLVNVTLDGEVTYSCIVDGLPKKHGTLQTADVTRPRPEAVTAAERADPATDGPPWWCETCTSWRHTMPCGREECPRPLDHPGPDAERLALLKMWEAYQELKRLGWNDAIYCPKDGSHFLSIEPGSTGIHDTNYQGEWPKGTWWVYDGDIWPARPCLWKAKDPVADVTRPRRPLDDAELLPYARLLELCAENGITETDALKHRLEDWNRWNAARSVE